MLCETIFYILPHPGLQVNKEPREFQASKGHAVQAMQKELHLLPTEEYTLRLVVNPKVQE